LKQLLDGSEILLKSSSMKINKTRAPIAFFGSLNKPLLSAARHKIPYSVRRFL